MAISLYDLSVPTSCHLSTLRPACRNTVRAGRAQGFASYTVKKTKRADLKVQYAREALGLLPKFTGAVQAELDELIKVHVTNAKFAEIVTDLFGPGETPRPAAQALWDAKFEQLMHLFTAADTQANIRNTGWAAVNAVGEYADWKTKTKERADLPGITADGVRFWRSLTDEKGIKGPKIGITQAVLALA